MLHSVFFLYFFFHTFLLITQEPLNFLKSDDFIQENVSKSIRIRIVFIYFTTLCIQIVSVLFDQLRTPFRPVEGSSWQLSLFFPFIQFIGQHIKRKVTIVCPQKDFSKRSPCVRHNYYYREC